MSTVGFTHECWNSGGAPFGCSTDQSSRIVAEINTGVIENYGHAGPQFVRWLVEQQQHWAAWREDHVNHRQRLQQRAAGNNVAARLGESLAAIAVTAQLVHQCFRPPWDQPDLVVELWEELTARSEEADRAAAALRYVLSWSYSNRNMFFGLRAGSDGPPPGGWAGNWGIGDWEYLGFLPHKLDEVLIFGGFRPEAVKNLWKDRGWLLRDQGSGKWRRRARLQGDNAWLIAIDRLAIEEVDGSPDD